MFDSVRKLWICDDCGYRYQAQDHLEKHLEDCYQYLNNKATQPPRAPVPAAVDDEPESDQPVRRVKRKES